MTMVLVADDDYDTRHVLDIALRAYGYECVVAGDGESAFALARERDVALVIAETTLECDRGGCLIRCLKADEALRHVPVLAYTAVRRIDWGRGGTPCYDGYLTKPASLGSVLGEVLRLAGPPRSLGQPRPAAETRS